jgi:HTH-like domain
LMVILRREDWHVNEKRVRRVMHELGLCGKAPVRKCPGLIPKSGDTGCEVG